ncbi:MAG: NepR family anti-sigma factor [Hyphomicrobiaceae bacterium]
MNNEVGGFAAANSAGRRDLMHQKDDKAVESEAANKATPNEDGHVLLPREAQGRIGQHLRRVYGEILSEPLPDKFAQLLDNLAKTERSE